MSDRIGIELQNAREAFKLFVKKDARAACAHVKTVTIRTAGLERTACESCGKVSFHALEGLSGRAERSQFERESERSRQTVV